MKTTPQTRLTRAHSGLWLAVAAIGSLVASTTLVRAEAPAAPATAETKEYTFFVGGNLEIPQGKDYVPVKKVMKYDLEVEVNKAPKKVAIEDVSEYRVVREVKLSNLSANIAIKRSERVEAGATRRKLEAFSQTATVQNAMQDKQSLALGQLTRASMTVNDAPLSGAPTSAGTPTARDEAVGAAMGKVSDAFASNDITNGAWVAKTVVDASVGDGRDSCNALELELEVSAPRQMPNAHLLLVTECRDQRKPDVPLRMITPKYIGDIGPKPVKVTFEQGGFPTGYILDKENLFLYSDNTEIVTNLSANRMELTRDQAFKYLLVQYIASHSKDNLAPTPIMGAAPADFRFKTDDPLLAQTIVITINKNGEVVSVSQEDAAPAKLPKPIDVALKSFRFFPALKNGMPSEGSVKVRLSSLFQNI